MRQLKMADWDMAFTEMWIDLRIGLMSLALATGQAGRRGLSVVLWVCCTTDLYSVQKLYCTVQESSGVCFRWPAIGDLWRFDAKQNHIGAIQEIPQPVVCSLFGTFGVHLISELYNRHTEYGAGDGGECASENIINWPLSNCGIVQ